MTGVSQWSCILWDMDGTIIDASEGILGRLRTTHDHLGLPRPTRADLIHWIGPPMSKSFRTNTGLDDEGAASAIAFYRSLHAADETGSSTHVFDGVAELLAEVSAAGVPQAIASSKPHDQVVPLAHHFGISSAFVAMVGADSDGGPRSTKAAVVAEALAQLAAAGADVSRPVLIGDRHHDVEGGSQNNVPVIFVTWGFSRPEERAGAIATATSVSELRGLILSE